MSLEPAGLSKAELGRLFPFHIAFGAQATPRIVEVGAGLEKLIGKAWQSARFGDLFEMIRPRGTADDFARLGGSGQTIVLKHRHGRLSLRGSLVPLGAAGSLFACSVEVTSSHTLEELGLDIKDFAPADPTPDIIILHRFRELQQNDQQRQIEELREAVNARDAFDRHANTDALTGIGNRRSFWNEGSKFISDLSDDQVAVILLMDLDGFKKVNDTHGHDVGDEVLQTVARRCQHLVGEHGIVSRLGGDEFVAMIRLECRNAVDAFVDDLMASVSDPMDCLNRRVSVRPSVGVSTLTRSQSVDEAIHYADVAMYEGRRISSGSISWFTPEMQAAEDYRKSMLADLGRAIEAREFVPYFQPIVDIPARRIHGYEALARWHHPTRGLIYPDTFVELAAEAGCLHELDYVILESSLDQLASWDRAGRRSTIHVNLCGSSVREGLDERTLRLLKERDIHASRLTLELTETTLLDFGAKERAVLDRLASQGVVMQLDDFGTGYSSLTHLHDFPVNGMKIDRSFLFDFPNNKRCLALIESVMEIASHLQTDVVAEGIETREQLGWIESVGCRFGQGYLFGKPVPASECIDALASWPVHVDEAA